VVDYGLCHRLSSGSATVATAAVSGLTVDLWEYVPRGVEGNDRAYVVISHAALVVHPRRGLVTNQVTLTVDEDADVTIARGVDGAASFYRLD
jgi:hypothetical protein